jgi:hypothetical protein
MQISLADWIVILPYYALSLEIGLYYDRRVSEDIGTFYVNGSSVPCRLEGASAGRRPDSIGGRGQTQPHISGGNGRLVCQ